MQVGRDRSQILIVGDVTVGGGTETYFRVLVSELGRRGHTVTAVVGSGRISKTTRDAIEALSCGTLIELGVALDSAVGRAAVKRLRPSSHEKVLADAWDVVIISAGTPGRLLKHTPKAHKSFYLAHTYPRGVKSLLLGWLHGLMMMRFTSMLTVSQFARQRFLLHWRMPRHRIIALSSPLTVPPNVGPKPIPPGGIEILAVGSLEADKNPESFIESAYFLSQLLARRSVKFRWVGGGTLESQFQTHVRARGLESIVRLEGRLEGESLAKAYRRAHILLHASTRESYGFVPIEAASFGLHVITSAAGGLLELKTIIPSLRVSNFHHGALLAKDLLDLIRTTNAKPSKAIEPNRAQQGPNMRPDWVDEIESITGLTSSS